MLNKCSFIGNLGADPDIRLTQTGDKIVNLSVGVTQKWKDKNGGKQEKTEWVRAVVFNKAFVGVCENYLKKGSKVYIEGQLETRKWQDQSGADRYTTEIVLRPYKSELVMLDKRESVPQESVAQVHGGGGFEEDSIPF